jgi:Velvet factor
VKVEGNFFLRYRFDLFSKPWHHCDIAIQAECYGGNFQIYSTKKFPGLQASTDLTKASPSVPFTCFLIYSANDESTY